MYVVTKRFGRNETRVKECGKEVEAINFILEKLKEDKELKIVATYGLYEGADLIKEFTVNDIPVSAVNNATEDESAGSQKSSTQSFRPTPFNTTPRLGPQTGLQDDSKNKEDK